jgi:hypothetical protein
MPFPPPPQPYQGPNYQGFKFTLHSTNGKDHKLTIATQVGETMAHQAYITGTWEGASSSSAKPVTGLITENGLEIKCSWDTPNGKNTLVGSLFYTAGHFIDETVGTVPFIGFVPPEASLDGTVTAYDINGNVLPGKGPGDVSGSGSQPGWWI